MKHIACYLLHFMQLQLYYAIPRIFIKYAIANHIPWKKFPNEYTGIIFIQIDQHLKKLLKKYKGVPILWNTVCIRTKTLCHTILLKRSVMFCNASVTFRDGSVTWRFCNVVHYTASKRSERVHSPTLGYSDALFQITLGRHVDHGVKVNEAYVVVAADTDAYTLDRASCFYLSPEERSPSTRGARGNQLSYTQNFTRCRFARSILTRSPADAMGGWPYCRQSYKYNHAVRVFERSTRPTRSTRGV